MSGSPLAKEIDQARVLIRERRRQIRYGDFAEDNQEKFLVSVTFDYESRPLDAPGA